jgi:hypothetical protein
MKIINNGISDDRASEDKKLMTHANKKVRSRARTLDYSKGGNNSIYLRRPQELLNQARKLYIDTSYVKCIAKLMECQWCPEWEDLSLQMKTQQPKLFQFVRDCHLLTAHSEMKLERYRKATDTCDTILRVEECHEALIIRGTCLAAIE